jgi:hypothetical protein
MGRRDSAAKAIGRRGIRSNRTPVAMSYLAENLDRRIVASLKNGTTTEMPIRMHG